MVLHLKITHFDSVSSDVITSVVSVASCPQVSHLDYKCCKCQKTSYCHLAYVVPLTTSWRHLRHLKGWFGRRKITWQEVQALCHWKNHSKNQFCWGALPYPLSGSASAPWASLGECLSSLCTLMGENYPLLRKLWVCWGKLGKNPSNP